MSSSRRRSGSPAPRYNPPPRGSGLGGILLGAAVMLGLILVVAAWGDKLPLPPKVTDGAKSVATSVAPTMFPPTAEQAASESDFTCRVSKVTDGDSIRCQDGKRIRLHPFPRASTTIAARPAIPAPTWVPQRPPAN